MACRANDADTAASDLNAPRERAEMTTPIAAAIDPDPFACRPGEVLHRLRRDRLLGPTPPALRLHRGAGSRPHRGEPSGARHAPPRRIVRIGERAAAPCRHPSATARRPAQGQPGVLMNAAITGSGRNDGHGFVRVWNAFPERCKGCRPCPHRDGQFAACNEGFARTLALNQSIAQRWPSTKGALS